jgi:hypothetical protein
MLRAQAAADAAHFAEQCGRDLGRTERDAVNAKFLEAYRYQYIFSGVKKTRFTEILRGFISDGDFERVGQALASLA